MSVTEAWSVTVICPHSGFCPECHWNDGRLWNFHRQLSLSLSTFSCTLLLVVHDNFIIICVTEMCGVFGEMWTGRLLLLSHRASKQYKKELLKPYLLEMSGDEENIHQLEKTCTDHLRMKILICVCFNSDSHWHWRQSELTGSAWQHLETMSGLAHKCGLCTAPPPLLRHLLSHMHK